MKESELHAMIRADERHWWYRGRRGIVLTVIGALPLPRPGETTILDAGCGSGRTLDDPRNSEAWSGSTPPPECVAAARARGHSAHEASVDALPFEDKAFDLVTSPDVLEHTPNHVSALCELRRVLRVGAYLVVTVPAYPALCSSHDEVNDHYRRYRRRDVEAASRKAGLDIVRESFFNALLLARAALVRLARRHVGSGQGAERGHAFAAGRARVAPHCITTGAALPLP